MILHEALATDFAAMALLLQLLDVLAKLVVVILLLEEVLCKLLIVQVCDIDLFPDRYVSRHLEIYFYN